MLTNPTTDQDRPRTDRTWGVWQHSSLQTGFLKPSMVKGKLHFAFYFPNALQTDTLIKSIKTNYWENEINKQQRLQGPIFLLLDRTNRHKTPLSNYFQTMVLS